MSTYEQYPKTSSTASAGREGTRKPRSVQKCNFRAAGHLSNEDARSLTALHDTFVRSMPVALDAYLGKPVTITLDAFEQGAIEDHVREVPETSYVVAFAGSPILLEFDRELVFPIVDLLMGGTGTASTVERELSEIDEEIMQDVFLIIARHARSAWNVSDFSLTPGPRIKRSEIPQSFAPHERLGTLRFAIQVAAAEGSFRLVFSIEFIKAVMKKIRASRPANVKRLWEFKSIPLRERILDGEIEVTTELPKLRVSVRDLIALQPGSVLKLRAPIQVPGMLTAGGWDLFEALPVRNGSQRAAQLGCRAPLPRR